DEVRLAVRRQVKQGVDGLKIMSTGGRMTPRTNVRVAQYTVQQLRAAVEETRRAGLTIAAHGHGTAGIRNAALAGVDTIEHCTWLGEGDEELHFDEEAVGARVGGDVIADGTMSAITIGARQSPRSVV